jgi:hypothetical protein
MTTMTNRLFDPDPDNFDRGPVTSGVRIDEDKRSHLDRINGLSVTGPAVVPRTLVVVDRANRSTTIAMPDLVNILINAGEDARNGWEALAHGEGGLAKIKAVLLDLIRVIRDVAPLVAEDPTLEAEVQAFLDAANVLLTALKAPVPEPAPSDEKEEDK